MLPNRSIPRSTAIPELAYPDLGNSIGFAALSASPCVCELRIIVPN